MLFSYNAKLKGDEIIKGTLEAPDRFSLARDLRSRGYTPLAIWEKSQNLAGKLQVFGTLFAKLQAALICPGIILPAMVMKGFLMFALVVRALAGTFNSLGVTLPASTQFIIFFGNFFSNHLLLTFVILIGAGFGLYSIFRAKFM